MSSISPDTTRADALPHGFRERAAFVANALPRSRKEARTWALIAQRMTQTGWLTSHRGGQTSDPTGPWLNFAASEFLDAIVEPTSIVFEYGSGRSTEWLGERAAEVVSVESDTNWFESVGVRVRKLENVKLIASPCMGDATWAPEGDTYVESLRDSGLAPDVVLIDGRARMSCLAVAQDAVRAGGWIVLDDAERSSYADGLDKMRCDGAKVAVLWDLKPSGVLNATAFIKVPNPVN